MYWRPRAASAFEGAGEAVRSCSLPPLLFQMHPAGVPRSLSRELTSSEPSDETKDRDDEAIFVNLEKTLTSNLDKLFPIKQRGTIMWGFISLIYRHYCRARLAEMRKFRLSPIA